MKINIKNAGMISLSLMGGGLKPACIEAQDKQHPNIVLIITDQQQAGKISWYGASGLSTPTMDRLARNGINFCNSYCAFPLSIPQRFAMFTGMYPSTINLRVNPEGEDRNKLDFEKERELQPGMLASLFNAAGYDTYYGGKAHLVSPKNNEDPGYFGFKHIYTAERRNLLGADAAEFLKTKSPKDNPFLMVVSYINPHDICEFDDYAEFVTMDPKRRETKHEGLSRVSRYISDTYAYPEDKFYKDMAPGLPDNFAQMENLPKEKLGKVSKYTDEQWQMHRWVYNRLIEEVDSDIAPVVRQLEEGGFLENTIIVFLSDHGDMDASHHMEHKTAPYQECQKVPFIICGPGIQKGVIDNTVVNTGVDLLPTLCDLANIGVPEGYPGVSLKGLATGSQKKVDRKYIFCESSNWYQVIEEGRYKLTLLDGNEEILVDLEKNPGELNNLVSSQKYDKIRFRLEKVLNDELARRKRK